MWVYQRTRTHTPTSQKDAFVSEESRARYSTTRGGWDIETVTVLDLGE